MKLSRDIKLHIELENEEEINLLRILVGTGYNKTDYSQHTELSVKLNSFGYDLHKYLCRSCANVQ